MFCEYIQAALSRAIFEMIDDEEPYYGEVPELVGVWAAGKSEVECRENLRLAIEDWIAFSLRFDLPIPAIEGHKIEVPEAPVEA
ncbi:type II toxin-antitoxin system HicB family antitoxin [Methanotrichaceae archaeon M04Ac]|jgi:predicted RNase H-like HicB family nuclease|uniref:Type II toxin-antitoxin system HicB family antitoxin n=1 Tax=Candidatus Methanocrinis alkalitolerans TaxID=3033395 RepID=A0ABT5XCM4_9EURY|nr:type II toxin-antitoxin system HicB family antitoxin [Candidatus Methanocrinis alkalitolerans]MCR3883135.1 type II toxin-antitoxin system HicB family antitoxin [Methanothrix sp.]MDF0592401.1 type II toxin-antitoxin system HicB family antitoxin [Candidatus Methanocrinis alkalitolerans]